MEHISAQQVAEDTGAVGRRRRGAIELNRVRDERTAIALRRRRVRRARRRPPPSPSRTRPTARTAADQILTSDRRPLLLRSFRRLLARSRRAQRRTGVASTNTSWSSKRGRPLMPRKPTAAPGDGACSGQNFRAIDRPTPLRNADALAQQLGIGALFLKAPTASAIGSPMAHRRRRTARRRPSRASRRAFAGNSSVGCDAPSDRSAGIGVAWGSGQQTCRATSSSARTSPNAGARIRAHGAVAWPRRRSGLRGVVAGAHAMRPPRRSAGAGRRPRATSRCRATSTPGTRCSRAGRRAMDAADARDRQRRRRRARERRVRAPLGTVRRAAPAVCRRGAARRFDLHDVRARREHRRGRRPKTYGADGMDCRQRGRPRVLLRTRASKP